MANKLARWPWLWTQHQIAVKPLKENNERLGGLPTAKRKRGSSESEVGSGKGEQTNHKRNQEIMEKDPTINLGHERRLNKGKGKGKTDQRPSTPRKTVRFTDPARLREANRNPEVACY